MDCFYVCSGVLPRLFTLFHCFQVVLFVFPFVSLVFDFNELLLNGSSLSGNWEQIIPLPKKESTDVYKRNTMPII